MRVLMVGAGATGGYYGGRLAEAGRDVTFLVRPARAQQLAKAGLVLASPAGDARIPSPRTITAPELAAAGASTAETRFDLVVVGCKAYDLDGAIADLAPAIGPDTAILPILNGMRHLDALDARFGADRILGGSCAIVATLDADGGVRHLGGPHSLTFGERDGTRSGRVGRIAEVLAPARFEARPSERILLEMWEKWVFLATLAGATCLMRGAVGDVVGAPAGRAFVEALIEECRSIAAAAGHAPRDEVLANARETLTRPGSPMTASMLRDLETGGRIEADHIVGDLLARGRDRAPAAAFPLLDLVALHLGSYERRRAREAEVRAMPQ